MRYFLIAGEASGDNLGALLMQEIKCLDPAAEFAFWGGDNMTAACGLSPKQHIRQLAFMGFVEVLANFRTITKLIARAKVDVAAFRPDSLICIDYPGFNLRLSKWALSQNMWVDFYVSPQIWAWRQSRVHKIIASTSRLLCILPFEPDFYAKFGYEVAYTGHPLPKRVDSHEVPAQLLVESAAGKHEVTKPILAILPGSRQQEIKVLMTIMIAAAKSFAERQKENWQLVIAASPVLSDKELRALSVEHEVAWVRNAYDLLAHASLASVASGSASLETALFRVPQVVCYKGNAVSVALARHLIKIEYIALPNLILQQALVPELIQSDLSAESLCEALTTIYESEEKSKIMAGYEALRNLLEPYDAASAAAKIIVESAGLRNLPYH